MPLKNRQQAIPGGFDWNQPETGFTFRSDVFTTTRDEIIADRMRNPRHKLRTDIEHVEWEMEQRYEAKLRAMPGGEQWLILAPADSPPPVFRQPRSRSGPAAALSNATHGIGAIKDWLGNGLRPVPQETADSRATICNSCPHNQDGNWWQRFEGQVADKIKALVQVKNSMKLITKHDESLKSCTICDCSLPTKIWVPIEHVLANTSEKTMAALPDFCWVKLKT